MNNTILPFLKLDYLSNTKAYTSGSDSEAHCLDKDFFSNYLYSEKISYVYNSRGFRDTEWPDSIDELKESIWCFGDSFTVGLGSPIEHTWPYILQKESKRRCINVSMDGASNEWIARKVNEVVKEINPDRIIIMWSYCHRDESPDESLPDNERRMWFKYYDDDKSKFLNQFNFNNDLHKFTQARNKLTTKVAIESIIPLAFTIDKTLPQLDPRLSWHADFNSLNNKLLEFIHPVEQVDFARDKHHFDILTSTKFVKKLLDIYPHLLIKS